MEIYFSVGEAEGTVGNPCIQTKLKSLYNHKVSILLKKTEITDEDSKEIELLKYALENFNFSLLRSRCELHKSASWNKVLLENKNNEIKVLINDVMIHQEEFDNGD